MGYLQYVWWGQIEVELLKYKCIFWGIGNLDIWLSQIENDHLDSELQFGDTSPLNKIKGTQPQYQVGIFRSSSAGTQPTKTFDFQPNWDVTKIICSTYIIITKIWLAKNNFQWNVDFMIFCQNSVERTLIRVLLAWKISPWPQKDFAKRQF